MTRGFKKWIVLLWLLVPVGLVSYHFGPGQEALAWRESAEHRNEAERLEQTGHWEEATTAYQQAINSLPPITDDDAAGTTSRDQLRLAQIRTRFQLGRLEETIFALRSFIDEVESTHGPASTVALESRELLGRVHYQAMIALRLESAEKEVWQRQWELARQNYRFLAERSSPGRNGVDRKNLEVVIKSADLPVEAFPPPPTGGAASAAANANPTFVPPPPTGAATTIITASPDNRPRAPKPSLSELTPPEFELGS
jgi:hypothetical protein